MTKKKRPVKKKTLAECLKRRAAKSKTKPVWAGPNAPRGGITQSLLSIFLCCRERFRLRVIEGLASPDQFNHRIEYGNMWHLCEEVNALDDLYWDNPLETYTRKLCQKYPLQQEQIIKWYEICKLQFPVYLKYWAKDPDEKRRRTILQEEVFSVPYSLPSGRIVYLKGKMDGVSKYGRKYYLDEHKTKGEVSPEQMRIQMNFDLQTMLYLVALRISEKVPVKQIAGVRYNVVLRPLSGGKHSIRQLKPTKKNPQGESSEEFYERLGGLIAEDPGHYFHRWVVDITEADVLRFCDQFLNPILEQLCDWWEWMQTGHDAFGSQLTGIHWRTPYGFYNVLGEGGSTDLDEYLASGSEVGLVRGKPVFQELVENANSKEADQEERTS